MIARVTGLLNNASLAALETAACGPRLGRRRGLIRAARQEAGMAAYGGVFSFAALLAAPSLSLASLGRGSLMLMPPVLKTPQENLIQRSLKLLGQAPSSASQAKESEILRGVKTFLSAKLDALAAFIGSTRALGTSAY